LRLPTFLALAIATALCVIAGWWMAGRMMRPINEIATVARRLSASTLHERIALEGSHDELRELADTFDGMLDRLESSFIAQHDFVANASHELRTPLTIMRTELDVTLADPDVDAEELRHMATAIRGAIARSEDVIDSLLVLAESDAPVERKPVDLATLVRQVVRHNEQPAAERGLTLQIDAGAAIVLGDEALLERLADNLVGNAIRYSVEGGTTGIDVRRTSDAVLLTVANAGDVIDESELPRLFERFYRRDRSRSRRAGGSGLGLAIVAAIADAHGGTVVAEAIPSGGLRVTVRLPSAEMRRTP
jgi:signal transduction histidine kinase